MREYAADWESFKATDPEIADAIAGELERERTTLRLIASENYASPAVLAAVGSTLSDKYAEGYPGRRYYGGGPLGAPGRPTPGGGRGGGRAEAAGDRPTPPHPPAPHGADRGATPPR